MLKIVQTIYEVIGISKTEDSESITKFGLFIDEDACLKKIAELELEKRNSEFNYKTFRLICDELYDISCQTISGKSSEEIGDIIESPKWFANIDLVKDIDKHYEEQFKNYDFTNIPFRSDLNEITKFDFRKVYVYG